MDKSVGKIEFRVTQKFKDKLDKYVSSIEDLTRSELIREAINYYIDREGKIDLKLKRIYVVQEV